MADLEIANELLSTILNQEIVYLYLYPQENIAENEQIDKTLRVYRLDFAAIIQEPSGRRKYACTTRHKLLQRCNDRKTD